MPVGTARGVHHRRGVDVRILTNGRESDVKTTWLAGRNLDDLRFADEIRLESFRKRSRTQRLLERAASVLASLL